MIIFYFVLLLSSLNSIYFLETYKSSIFYFRFFTFSLFLAIFLKKYPKLIYYSYFIVFYTLLIVTLDGLTEYFTGYNLSNEATTFPGRIRGLFDELIIGSYLTKLLPLLVALYLFNFNKISRLYKIVTQILFILIVVLVFFSGERTSFYLLFLFLIYIFLFCKFSLKQKIKSLIILLLFVLTIILIKPSNYDNVKIFSRMMVSPIKTINEEKFGNKKSDIIIFSNQHTDLYKAAYDIYLDHKLIGSGPNSFRYICKTNKYNKSDYSCNTHPHNYYLQLIAETGLIGFFIVIVLYASLITLVLFPKIFGKKLDNFQILLLGSIFINLFPFVPSANFFNNYNNIIIYYPVSFLIYSFIKKLDVKI